MQFDSKRFVGLVDAMPLVSIDLLLHDPEGRVLLGRRLNRPAAGFWFVPGGRVLKGERLADALARIVRRELGPAVPLQGWTPAGAYEHFYDDNFAGVADVSTHYVVLPHVLHLEWGTPEIVPDDQHDDMMWLSVPELLARDDVHAYSKAYFLGR
ncbi:GDP-mannose mannosyl hydrolase [Thauera sinica]|uniref:GDP-mannose mannosyl hydrolase n=1 Tax=Thauera sinica TaxID=2665146 RepID=A0ABW1ANG5_9RHOO|nr:GDP-mannose mannosyl hydrolase [Thauera sp. K11]ATE60524.1 GDP-mannose mannosyl hydrolase [Thauera sp. K11]